MGGGPYGLIFGVCAVWRFFGDCAPAKKVAILTSCNRVILNGQNSGAAGWGGGGGGAWCVGGVLEARRTQGTRQLEV